MDKNTIARRLKIHGEVQGVGFRAFAKRQADTLGLKGYVRNRTDNTVEVLACGQAAAIESFIALCRQGPAAARVERTEIEETEEPTEAGFKQTTTV